MSLAVLDLFAGCGGLSLGLQRAGFRVVAAVEKDVWASETYAHNHPNTELLSVGIETLSSDFLQRRFRGQVDVVAGGPPCQGFSVSGKRQWGVFLEKNRLVHEYIRVVDAVSPPLFLLENVRGFTSASIDGREKALSVLLYGLERLGYHLYSAVLQAADFGIPQYRGRLFVVGSREQLSESPFPKATHAALPRAGLNQYLSIMDAISDLPDIHAGEGTDGAQPYTKMPSNSFQVTMRADSQSVFNHQAMKHTRRLVDRFAEIKPGESAYKLGNDGDAAPVTVYKSNNQRLVPSLPSLCITANFQSNYVHPILHRNLTAREAARLQTFPDSFVFKGRRTLMSSTLLAAEGRHGENHLSQYNQIGNAVPPLLAQILGERLLEVRSGRLSVVGPCVRSARPLHQMSLTLHSVESITSVVDAGTQRT
jgi:DNA (cytosine-5)-methyltransferase 1